MLNAALNNIHKEYYENVNKLNITYSQSQEGGEVWGNWGADEFKIAHVTSSGSSIEIRTVNSFREVLSFADLELEYNGGVENDEQTLPYGIVPLSERLSHLLDAVILDLPTICWSCSLLNNER
ncbi:hypothetical protein T07_4494 [Trichinella nelsoni]|uniref:Uncharacterized protein n=1 Tax=Trichinella nelsoni TaxID=6336 RepID=A0A0V0RWF0_9BILA|nr:hypothetical protein T07_4494 [Trichinella nelsoni]